MELDLEARLKTFKPNDLRPGDVIEQPATGGLFLVVDVEKLERKVTFIVLRDHRQLSRDGTRIEETFERKRWKRFCSSVVYVTRGWDETLRTQEEEASDVKSMMMNT